MKREFNIATRLLVAEAEKRGISTEVIQPGKVMKFKLGGHEEYTYAQMFSQSSGVANRACADKAITKVFLKKAGVSVADSLECGKNDFKEALDFAEQKQWNIVFKPTRGEKGKLVFTTISSEEDLEKAWKEMFLFYDACLIEEKFEGKEYRVLATREKVLGIAYRKPANVEGDGSHTIQELIDIKNSDPRRSDNIGDPVVKIKINDEVLANLKQLNLTLESIPMKGETVYLRKNSNISTGGESFDFTDEADDSVKEIAVKAVSAIPGLAYGGVDFMTKDINESQNKDSYIIVEMNCSPGIDLHHFPYKGTQRDVAKDLMDLIFPETVK